MQVRDRQSGKGGHKATKPQNIFHHKAAVLGPRPCAWAAKLERQTRCPIDAAEAKGHKPAVAEPIPTRSERIFKLSGEPLYGGKVVQGDEREPAEGNAFEGLRQPRLQETKGVVCGEDKTIMRKENKRKRQELRAEQPLTSPWSSYEGETPAERPTDHSARPPYRNSMCPTGRALRHPAAEVLKEWAQFGCPTLTGKPWTKEEMWEAVARGPHRSALSPEAIAHFKEEAAMKLKEFRSILDLSFRLRLKNGGVLASVNDTTEKIAPAGAINQIGECLSCIIHALAEADNDAKIFMAKWDIKDGFWQMDCAAGEEWNFTYVLLQDEGMPTTLVIPTLLQMGWVESPPYFCAATETSRDIAIEYAETKLNSLDPHKFEKFVVGTPEYANLPEVGDPQLGFVYMVEVYVDDFMSLVIPVSQEQLRHVANAIMHGIHDVFPPDEEDSNDPISEKKLKKGEGRYDTRTTLLGFDFDGKGKAMWLEAVKRKKLLTILKGWIQNGTRGSAEIPFGEFESTIAKLRHAFTCIPAGRGLLSPCNRVMQRRPTHVYLQRNLAVLTAIRGCRTLLRESTTELTRCRELVAGWPDYVGIVDASGHGASGVVLGENSACTPAVFHWEWPEDIKKDIKTFSDPSGRLSNSDLEMAGLVILWLVVAGVCANLREKRVALFSDNSPTVGWVTRLASKRSVVAERLIQALALRLKSTHTCPLTPLHIKGIRNKIVDIPSRSFGSDPAWKCTSDAELLTLFNNHFPLPQQQSWTVYRPSYAVVTRVTSILQMKPFALDDWRRLPTRGKCAGEIGAPMSKHGSGSVLATGTICNQSTMPYRFCSTNKKRVLRIWTTGPK